jgi:hypothetical protein
MRFIGIDPGVNGAVVTLDGQAFNGYDEQTVTGILTGLSLGESIFIIEKIPKFVAGSDKIPLSRMCTLYGSYKHMLGVLHGLKAVVLEVVPQRWQKVVCGRLTPESYHEHKRTLKSVAENLAKKEGFKPRITLTNCDAFLLAYYGKMTHYD